MIMPITAYYAFILKCRDCGEEVEVGPTREFIEAKTDKNLTAYYDPQTEKLVGVSEGSGDSFECKRCHAHNWSEEVRNEDV